MVSSPPPAPTAALLAAVLAALPGAAPGCAPGEADDDTAPADDDSTPGDDDTAPGDDDSTPADDDSTPGDDDTAPGDDDTAPADDDSTPRDDDTVPSDDDSIPGDDDTVPSDDDSAPPHPDPPPFRVLTFNLRTPLLDPGDVEARTQQVIDAIALHEPDFVALQEVTEGIGLDNRAEAIADATGYAWAWQQTHDFWVLQEGPGLLSRWPISWTEAEELPHDEAFGLLHRAVLGAGLEAPAGEVRVFATHLTTDGDEEVKADQAAAVAAFAADHPGDLPAFLGGDMNAEPDSLPMRFLRGEEAWDGATAAFADAWLAVAPDDPGYTYPASAPDRRIDYVYAAAGTAGAAVATGCALLFADAVDGLLASDHLGVLCDFDLPGTR